MASALSDKLVVITGGGRGIGAAFARRCASEGAKLALVARTESQLQETAELCKKEGATEVGTFTADLTSSPAREQLIKDIVKAHGNIHVLVNNAGRGARPGNPLELDMDETENMLHLNLHAPIHLTRLVAPSMVEAKQGTILFLGSVAGIEPMQTACTYASTKWGVRGWALSCYQSLRQHGIKVSIVHPGMVATSMTSGYGMNTELMIQPEDVAEAMFMALKTKQSCTPVEITLRPTEPVTKA
eukprot:CAMPEP_0206149188 /NCGR_PEP_ID=MMETSP1473-20131121/37650_1 /ASSEMBLY_ACC=CAM_ASM_001109 /TAXON_ID=1461547 /ORGANISM="Stichococcus sp, Strain RCC1054" /LENGTH=242 /DNA_ID=CAMNT_0053546639 /DNA_START=569 /DNA_END=1297 /DNA_ORIENTATION=-